MIGEQQSLQDFLRGFMEFTKEIPLKSVRPATSTVVYRTTCEAWTPENFRAGIPALHACEQVHDSINHAEHTLVIVTARRVPLVWTNVKSLFSWEWELYVVIWSPEQHLLFINSSTNSGEYRALAQAVAGQTAALVKGQDVFRTFAGVNRLRLQNVGLTEQLGRNVRYTGRMGADVGPGVRTSIGTERVNRSFPAAATKTARGPQSALRGRAASGRTEECASTSWPPGASLWERSFSMRASIRTRCSRERSRQRRFWIGPQRCRSALTGRRRCIRLRSRSGRW